MSIKVLGGKNLPSYWERFNRLQRTAHKLGALKHIPKGVYRFESHKEYEEWKLSLSQKSHDHQKK